MLEQILNEYETEREYEGFYSDYTQEEVDELLRQNNIELEEVEEFSPMLQRHKR